MKRVMALVAVALLLTGCSETHKDAPEPQASTGTSAIVLQEPNGFRNVAFLCFGPVGVYVTSRGDDGAKTTSSGIAVLMNDPHCVGEAK